MHRTSVDKGQSVKRSTRPRKLLGHPVRVFHRAVLTVLMLWAFVGPGFDGLLFGQTREARVVTQGWPTALSVTGLADRVEVSRQAVRDLARSYLEALKGAGFAFARLDSAVYKPSAQQSMVVFYFSPGPRVVFGGFLDGEVFLKRPGFLRLRGNTLSEDDVVRGLGELRTSLLNQGHPFFLLEIDSVLASGRRDTVWLAVDFDPGKPVRLHGVRFHGAKRTRESLLARFLNLHSGALFSRRKLEDGLARLARLPYIRKVVDWQLSALNDTLAVVDIWVEEARTNRVDGVLGYVPGELGRPGFFTGLVDLGLGNLMGTGRALKVYWRKRDRLSQDLSLAYAEPFLWRLPIGVEVGFQQKVQDSTYVERNWRIGMSSVAVRNWRVYGLLEQRSVLPDSTWGRLLGIPKSNAFAASAELEVDHRDDSLFPTRGAYFSTTVRRWQRWYAQETSTLTSGKRRRENEVDLDLEAYVPLWGRQVFATRTHLRQLQTGRREVPLSEQFRIGGARTLRGYREDQFAGTSLAWTNLEWRALLGPRSWAYLFADVARVASPKQVLWRFGYGVGIRLETRLGVLGVDYGLGEGDTFATGKVHVTLVAEF